MVRKPTRTIWRFYSIRLKRRSYKGLIVVFRYSFFPIFGESLKLRVIMEAL